MKKVTLICDKCGTDITMRDKGYYSPPEYIEVTVTERSNGPTPAVLGWSNTDTYHFCLDCERSRNAIKHLLLGTIDRRQLPRPPASACIERDPLK